MQIARLKYVPRIRIVVKLNGMVFVLTMHIINVTENIILIIIIIIIGIGIIGIGHHIQHTLHIQPMIQMLHRHQRMLHRLYT